MLHTLNISELDTCDVVVSKHEIVQVRGRPLTYRLH